MHTPPRLFPRLFAFACSLLLVNALSFQWAQGADTVAAKQFDLPAGAAAETLKTFSEQAGVQVLYPADGVGDVTTNAVQGLMLPQTALQQMVAGTVLTVVYDAKTGAFGVRRKTSQPGSEKNDDNRLPKDSVVLGAPAAEVTNGRVAGDAIVRLSPFEVSGHGDKGYLAANSVSASRINTPIKDLPFAISAFTTQFIHDIGAEKLLDIVSYSPGVKSAVINVQLGDATFTIRGFPQAPQRNGFYNTPLANNFVDPQVVERVEVVKGPASLLYGQVSPGGTVNYITKSPKPTAFAQLSGEVGSYNYSRETVDLNQPLIGQSLLFRVNASYERGSRYYDRADSDTRMIAPVLTWNISPALSVRLDYQWYSRNEHAPRQYLPPSEIATPASIVNALYGAGFPSPAAALVNKTGPGFVAGYADASDPGFMGLYPLLPHNFNFAAATDSRTTALQSLHTEIDTKLGENWTARFNFAHDRPHIILTATGVANLFLPPPNSLVYTNGLWSVAPSWSAMTTAQQTAATLAFAEQAVNNLGLLVTSQNGTPGPAIINRPPRVQERFGQGTTYQAEAVGHYDIGGIVFKPLMGVLYDDSYDQTRNYQNAGKAGSPAFRSWDINPSSPSYFIDPNTPSYEAGSLTVRNAYTSSHTSDQAAYFVLNANLFHERLILIGGLRYNQSESQTTNYNAAQPVGQGLKAQFTTPQAGIGFKISPDLLLYSSYSKSYTLPSQPFLTTVGSVNGVTVAVPTSPTEPTIGEGFETGIKTNFLNGRIASTVSIYQIEQTKVVQSLNQTISGIGVQIFVQGEVIRARGVEAELTWSPLDNLQVYASAAEEDIRIVQEPFGLSYYLGQIPNSTAKTMGNLWMRYAVPENLVKGVWIGGGFQYTGRSAGDPRNVEYFVPGYTLLNAALGYDWMWGRTGMSAMVNFKNIAGTFYKQTTGSAGDPRRVSLTVTAKF
ncbi:MAG: TonB-dependent receptor [Opitutaceae bacterium]